MGGQNPYIGELDIQMPTKKYKVRFLPMDVTVEVDPDDLGKSHDGLPGSILDIALSNGIEIDHACGGVCACSTCHVILKEGAETCNEAVEEEDDMLENAPGLRANSRLSCQAVPNGTKDVVVEVPNWNRNLAREPH